MGWRYNMDFSVELRKVTKAAEKVEEFLVKNGLCDELDGRITDEVKQRIRAFLPKEKEPANNLEWNVFYRLYLLDSIGKRSREDEDTY